MLGLTTGELAKRAGVRLDTVRFYERKRLLPAPPRSDAGYRAFPASAVRRLQFIKGAQELGFSLAEIGELLSLRTQPGATCATVRRRAEAKIQAIDLKIASLRAIRKALCGLAAACSRVGPVEECTILDGLERQGIGASR